MATFDCFIIFAPFLVLSIGGAIAWGLAYRNGWVTLK